MSRQSNRLKGRLATVQKRLAKIERLKRLTQAEVDSQIADIQRHAALTIRVEGMPEYLHRSGKRFRVDFVADAFEFDFLRRGEPDVSAYACRLARDVALKVARVIEDTISGKVEVYV